MSAIDELLGQLNRSTSTKAKAYVGKVTEVLDTQVRVQTAIGLVLATYSGMTPSVDDEVLVLDGAVRGRVAKSSSVPVYFT